MKIELAGNTKSFGPVYLSAVKERGRGPMIQRSWVNEVEAPFRHGRGWALRVIPSFAVSIGRWWPTSLLTPGYTDDERLPVEEMEWLDVIEDDLEWVDSMYGPDLDENAEADILFVHGGVPDADPKGYQRCSLESSSSSAD